jgi:hypothetical protein
MRTITKNLYSFDELSPEAKERAINDARQDEGRLGYEWWGGVYDCFKSDMKTHGIGVDKIYFSGFWSQGDGACFTGYIDLTTEQLLSALPDQLRKDLITFNAKCRLLGYSPLDISYRAKIEHSGHYYHSGTMRIASPYNVEIQESDVDESPLLDEMVMLRDAIDDRNEYDDLALEIARGHADDLYRLLEQEYEYLTSEEFIAESLSNHDYEYDENGAFVY